jgi:hypothetical protein
MAAGAVPSYAASLWNTGIAGPTSAALPPSASLEEPSVQNEDP